MSVLQLLVDIDSDVHPELHAVLASMSASGPQAERLRQLAATGLIWEHLRVNVRPSVALTATMAPGGREVDADGPVPAAARPMRSSNQPGGAKASAGGAGMAVRELPILHDAVEGSGVARSARGAPTKDAPATSGGARARSAVAAPRSKVLEVETAVLAGVHSPAAAANEARGAKNQESARSAQNATPTRPSDDEAPATVDREVVSPPLRRARTRARLLRMKEKGLFSNGPDC